MPFTRRQQIPYRAMVSHAWATIGRTGRPDTDWYQRELHRATGKFSTRDCNHTSDYERAMAHFEAIAGDDIKWQMKSASGSAARCIHEIDRILRSMDLPDSYADSIAEQALGISPLPPLGSLNTAQLITILRALKIHAARQHTAAAPA